MTSTQPSVSTNPEAAVSNNTAALYHSSKLSEQNNRSNGFAILRTRPVNFPSSSCCLPAQFKAQRRCGMQGWVTSWIQTTRTMVRFKYLLPAFQTRPSATPVQMSFISPEFFGMTILSTSRTAVAERFKNHSRRYSHD